MRLILLSMIAILMGLAQAHAHDSAKEMLPGCRDYVAVGKGTIPPERGDFAAAMECVGTIKTILLLEQLLLPSLRFCRPKGVTTNDAVELAVREIEARPQMGDKPFFIMAIAAFQQHWPCQ
jgi:hypothetical protein